MSIRKINVPILATAKTVLLVNCEDPLAGVDRATYDRFMKVEDFGSYLRELRHRRGLTLRDLEREAGVSNPYLSQVETGRCNPPHPRILARLAAVYDVPPNDLLIAAGYMAAEYMKDSAVKGITRDKIEQAFEHVIHHPKFRYGMRLKGAALSLDVQLFIVEMYEKIKEEKLL